MWKVVYLTGIPASGKTTFANQLVKCIKPIQVISYSTLLREYLNVTHNDLREKSSKVVDDAVIATVDKILIDKVNEGKDTSHIVIDSHEITKEDYGFRAKTFTDNQLKELNLDILISLYTEPRIIMERMTKNPENRNG